MGFGYDGEVSSGWRGQVLHLQGRAGWPGFCSVLPGLGLGGGGWEMHFGVVVVMVIAWLIFFAFSRVLWTPCAIVADGGILSGPGYIET